MWAKGHIFNNYFGHHVAGKESFYDFIGELGQVHKLSAKEFDLISKIEYKPATLKRRGGLGGAKKSFKKLKRYLIKRNNCSSCLGLIERSFQGKIKCN